MMAPLSHASPRILSVSWGKMEIEALGKGKDFKLWPGGGRPWDWSETGTSHGAGIQVADIIELIENSCEIIILARGVFSRLKISPETTTYLKTQDVEVIATDIKRGVQIYNSHVEKNVRVGGLFHSTC